MEKKGIIIRIVGLIVGVVLLALATRIWIKANGLDQQSVKSYTPVTDPPAVSRTVEDSDSFGYLELNTRSNGFSLVTEKTMQEEVEKVAEVVALVTDESESTAPTGSD